MTLLLDTHSFLWFWWDDPQLSGTAKQAICDATNRKLISTVSCWEIAIKVSLKKLDLGVPYRGFIHEHMVRNNFELLQITDEHLARASRRTQERVKLAFCLLLGPCFQPLLALLLSP
jgi:PIN domain nuclease of toxin-antitoxin system